MSWFCDNMTRCEGQRQEPVTFNHALIIYNDGECENDSAWYGVCCINTNRLNKTVNMEVLDECI